MKVKKQTVSKKAMIAFIMVGPTLFWLAAFLVFPLIYAVGISFMEKGRYGGVEFILTLKNYMDMWNPIYFKVAAQSVKLAFHTSIICLLVAYPFAFILTRVSENPDPYVCC